MKYETREIKNTINIKLKISLRDNMNDLEIQRLNKFMTNRITELLIVIFNGDIAP